VTPCRALIGSLIDYAGLFPPSALPMAKAVELYSRYKSSPEQWILGRFVVPVARLDEFEAYAPANAGWRLSVLAGANLEADLERIARFRRMNIDVIEIKASDAAQIESAARRLPNGLTPYFEVSDVALIETIGRAGARAKIRTGGITPEAFPEAGHIARFIGACARSGTPFKATAGLHHPLRCYRALTYSSGGPSGWMYGFLNVFIAAVLARMGLAEADTIPLLLEESIEAFSFGDGSITWRGHAATTNDIAAARSGFAISFGSCSFEEPVNDLRALHLL
jgi:hypothetical protein